MHVENVRSVIEELEREYTVLSDKLNEHEKQTDGKEFNKIIFIYILILAIDRIINNLDKELKNKQKELEQLKNSDRDIDEHINEEKRNTDKYEVKLRNAQNKVTKSQEIIFRLRVFLFFSLMKVQNVKMISVFHQMDLINIKIFQLNK
jgi:chromosome segregation ATPase